VRLQTGFGRVGAPAQPLRIWRMNTAIPTSQAIAKSSNHQQTKTTFEHRYAATAGSTAQRSDEAPSLATNVGTFASMTHRRRSAPRRREEDGKHQVPAASRCLC